MKLSDDEIVKSESCYEILASLVAACTRKAVAEGCKPSDSSFELSLLYQDLLKERDHALYYKTQDEIDEGFSLIDKARPYLAGWF